MRSNAATPLILTASAARARYEDMCASPAQHTAAAWTTMAELLEEAGQALLPRDPLGRQPGGIPDRALALWDRAADCRHRARRIEVLRRTFSGVTGDGFRSAS